MPLFVLKERTIPYIYSNNYLICNNQDQVADVSTLIDDYHTVSTQIIIISYFKIDIKQDIKYFPNINLKGMLIFQNLSSLIKAKHLQG